MHKRKLEIRRGSRDHGQGKPAMSTEKTGTAAEPSMSNATAKKRWKE